MHEFMLNIEKHFKLTITSANKMKQEIKKIELLDDLKFEKHENPQVIWKCLAALSLRSKMTSPITEKDKLMWISRHAPGGNASRTGLVVTLNDRVIHWTSNRQSCTTLSSCESEILAHITGFKAMIGIRDLIIETWKNRSRVRRKQFGCYSDADKQYHVVEKQTLLNESNMVEG